MRQIDIRPLGPVIGAEIHNIDLTQPLAEHPVIRTHPETGRKALYVNSAFTTRIVGMKPNESRATLEFLYRHIEHIHFQCCFRWAPHSIAMWDNRCAQHHAA